MGVLSTGMATSIGSLPHTDPDTAAAVVLAAADAMISSAAGSI